MGEMDLIQCAVARTGGWPAHVSCGLCTGLCLCGVPVAAVGCLGPCGCL